MLESFQDVIIHLFHTFDYWAVFVMTMLESTLIPFPSEIPMTLVGIKSSHGVMNPWIGFFVGLAGVWLGTTINYLLGYFVGDIFIERYGKYFFIKKDDYHRAQTLFAKDANFYTFFGRLLPVVRHLISIPAGMAHMPYIRFITLSLLGSALWLGTLIIMGYYIGENTALIKTYILYITAGLTCLAVILWTIRHMRKRAIKKLLGLKK